MAHSWKTLDPARARSLGDSRLTLHWAAQIPSGTAGGLLAPVPDTSHNALTWDAPTASLATATLPMGVRAAVRPRPFTLALLGADGAVVDEAPLEGRTLEEGFAWVADALAARAGAPIAQALEKPAHDLPAHPVADGGAFRRPSAPDREQLEAWFHDAQLALEGVAARHPEAGPIRVWPHHFDIATLLSFAPDAEAEEAPSIGVGMTPGDGGVAEPYFYVNTWPIPAEPQVEALGHGGRWNLDGWVGAVLEGSRLTEADQRAQLQAFLEAALEACGRLVRPH